MYVRKKLKEIKKPVNYRIGPAGILAAIYAARCRFKTVYILDDQEGNLLPTTEVD